MLVITSLLRYGGTEGGGEVVGRGKGRLTDILIIQYTGIFMSLFLSQSYLMKAIKLNHFICHILQEDGKN